LHYCNTSRAQSRESAATPKECCNIESQVWSDYSNTILSVSLSPRSSAESCSSATLRVGFGQSAASLYSKRVSLLSPLARVQSCSAATLREESRESAATHYYSSVSLLSPATLLSPAQERAVESRVGGGRSTSRVLSTRRVL